VSFGLVTSTTKMDFVNFRDFNDWEVEDDDWESQVEAKVEGRGEDRTPKRQRMQIPSPDDYSTHLPNSWVRTSQSSWVIVEHRVRDNQCLLWGRWILKQH